MPAASFNPNATAEETENAPAAAAHPGPAPDPAGHLLAVRPVVLSGRRSALRQFSEALVCLALAITMFRSFAAEGYMISTGSMAPSLLGFHKRVQCPTCGFRFAVGVDYQDPSAAQAAPPMPRPAEELVTCPNCDQHGINIIQVPRNYGDQLLVHKHAYNFRLPQRWETVVFRNPTKPSEAYVKRIAGLPGESLRIIDGDVYVDGRIARKDWPAQRAVRILVNDHQFRPASDSHWRGGWQREPADSTAWRTTNAGFQLGAAGVPNKQPPDWIVCRHWIQSGGNHKSSVRLEHWAADVELTSLPGVPVRYDSMTQNLSCFGTLPQSVRQQLLEAAEDDAFRRAVEQLHDLSHWAPVTDIYGYNGTGDGSPAIPVRDVMLEALVHVPPGEGELVVELTDGTQVFRARLDLQTRQATLTIDGADEPVRTAPLPDLTAEPVLMEMSIFDRQVLLALDGHSLWEPWPVPDTRLQTDTEPPRQPARLAARGVDVNIEGLKLYRDIYYTRRHGQHAVDGSCRLGDEEYFVLGDNSPISHDSRRWADPVVHSRLLLGKPFLVHLPSRPGKLQLGDRETYVRIPDVSRIRYID